MKAIVVPAAGSTPVLVDDHPEPSPGAGELLVEVRASSVNPVDGSVAAGVFPAEHTWPVVLGRDFAGVVREVGPDVDGFGPGDEVFGYVPPVADGVVGRGTWAGLVVLRADEGIAIRPGALTVRDAGAAGVAALTALPCVDRVAPAAGDTLLVIGAAGGIGTAVVQLAAAAGARVLAPARAEHADALRQLGVTTVLDRDLPLADALRAAGEDTTVDALIDLVSADPESHAPRRAVVRDGGRIATVLPGAGEETFVLTDPSGIGRLAGLLTDGTLRVPIGASYALADAPLALAESATRHVLGKRAIEVG
jgi:NADPH:quinone reductase-like Zn-dependent oxidoreductase